MRVYSTGLRSTPRSVLVEVFAVILLLAPLMSAQQATGIIPTLVNFAGALSDSNGKPLPGAQGVTFYLYKDQQGGSPLWIETQNVLADKNGRYSAVLGATTRQGLPTELFASGEARWLGVQAQGQAEQPRIMLLAVPYALKAGDAQTLGGLPASAFVLAMPNGGNTVALNSNSSESSGSAAADPNVGGSGTAGYLAAWTDNKGDLGNSIISQTGTGSSAKIGINEKSPLFTLDVNGQELVRGLFEMATTNYATKTKGYNSNPINLESSAFNSGTGKYALNHFQWQAEPAGNNTNTPAATLNLLYGTDPAAPTETGLSLNSKGLFTFASGQTFPGTGTVTSVGLSAPSSDFTVSGSPITKSGTLGLNWTVAPTNTATANAIVKRDSAGGFVAGAITASAVDGLAPYGNGLYGESDGSATGDNGVEGVTYAGPGSGVVGLNQSSNGGIGVYANGGTGSGGIGVYGTGNVGVHGNGSSYGFVSDSNVQQARWAGGWVKAMLSLQGYQAPYAITACFNSFLAGSAATTPPCGFNLTENGPGDFSVDFGFLIYDRFAVATPTLTDGNCTMYADLNGTIGEFRCFAGTSPTPFQAYIVIF